MKLRLWIKPPAMCRRCAKFGHTLKNCTSTSLCCLRCAEEHQTEDCKAHTCFCPHCGGPHAAWEHSCPALRDQMSRAEEAQTESAGPPLPPRRPALREALADARVCTRRHQSGTPPPRSSALSTATCDSQTEAIKKSVETQTGPPERASAGVQTPSTSCDASTQTDPALVIPTPAVAAEALPPLGEESVPAAPESTSSTATSSEEGPETEAEPGDVFSPLQTRSQRAMRTEEEDRRREEEERKRPLKQWQIADAMRLRFKPAPNAYSENRPPSHFYYDWRYKDFPHLN